MKANGIAPNIMTFNSMIAGFCLDEKNFNAAFEVLDEMQIVNVATDPSCGGRGYARELLSRIFEEVSREGIVMVSLEVRVSNNWAIRLYEGLGFTRQGLRKSFYRKPTEDAIVMLLLL